jgi:hypothetical protein
MARKQSLKKRVSKTAGDLVNSKHLGDEPLFTETPTDLQYMQALTWYNIMRSKSDARTYLETYLKNVGRNTTIKTLRRVPDVRISDHAAWIARMLSRGCKLTERSKDKMESLLQSSLQFAEGPKPEKKALAHPQQTFSVQDRIRDKVSDFIAEFEVSIDRDGWTLSMYDCMQRKQLPSSLANKVAEFYKPIAKEAADLLKSDCDPDLREGYSSYSKAQLKQRAAFYESILADCARHASNAKKQKVVRKKKVVTADKNLKHLKYQKESKEYKVVSINPEKFLGAEELVTFNTKYKLLTVFTALDRAGLGVKGTTMINYDEAKSKSYRIGRKTEECVETALRGGKRVFAKMLTSLKECNLQHRINENTILLRI